MWAILKLMSSAQRAQFIQVDWCLPVDAGGGRGRQRTAAAGTGVSVRYRDTC
jgi:hypothetical protein